MTNAPLQAPTHWFHVFRAMVVQGDIAQVGAHAFAVYAVIKAHANYNSGQAYPSIDLISKLSGVSQAQVKRALNKLEKQGFLTKTKPGRSNLYTVREKIQINESGLPTALATWNYVPSTVKNTIEELTRAMCRGDLSINQMVHIERLNIQVNLGGGNTQIDAITLKNEWDKFSPSTQEELRKHLNLK